MRSQERQSIEKQEARAGLQATIGSLRRRVFLGWSVFPRWTVFVRSVFLRSLFLRWTVLLRWWTLFLRWSLVQLQFVLSAPWPRCSRCCRWPRGPGVPGVFFLVAGGKPFRPGRRPPSRFAGLTLQSAWPSAHWGGTEDDRGTEERGGEREDLSSLYLLGPTR